MKLSKNYEKMYKNITKQTLEYFTKFNNLKSMVIGVSGGIDSALVCALMKPICKELKIPLIGRYIHIDSNKPEERENARQIGIAFCDNYNTIDLTACWVHIKNDIKYNPMIDQLSINETPFETKIRQGNQKARLRMINLYDLAQYSKGLVLSTDNMTEYLLGFWTLHGDVGDFGPIQEYYKTEVYGLSKWLSDNKLRNMNEIEALQKCINITPTDGLGITSSDLDQIGVDTYKEVDNILIEYFDILNQKSNKTILDIFDSLVIKRHLASTYKRDNPFNIKRS